MASLSDFIANDFAEIFLLGFSAGALLAGTIAAIRAAVKIAIRVMRGRA